MAEKRRTPSNASRRIRTSSARRGCPSRAAGGAAVAACESCTSAQDGSVRRGHTQNAASSRASPTGIVVGHQEAGARRARAAGHRAAGRAPPRRSPPGAAVLVGPQQQHRRLDQPVGVEQVAVRPRGQRRAARAQARARLALPPRSATRGARGRARRGSSAPRALADRGAEGDAAGVRDEPVEARHGARADASAPGAAAARGGGAARTASARAGRGRAGA